MIIKRRRRGDMPIEHINKTDTLNEGREKLNAAIDGANAADVTSKAADTKATQALANSESTQTQLDTIVIDGDSSVEAAQARVDEKGVSHPTLKARIDDGFEKTNQQLAQTENELSKVRRNYGDLEFGGAWIDDDGRIEVYNVLKPIFDSKGIKGTIAVITDRVGTSGYMSWAQILELYNDGWTIASHTKSHANLSEVPLSVVEDELRLSKEALNSRGIKADFIVYPYGRRTQEVIKIAKKYYKAGFTTRADHNNRPLNSFELNRPGVGVYGPEPFTLETQKPFIDYAIQNKTTYFPTTHIAETPTERVHLIGEIIDYAHAQVAYFRSLDDVFEEHGNILDYGDNYGTNPFMSVGANGEIEARSLGVYAGKFNEYTATNIPSDFKPRTVTTNAIQAGYAEDLPERGGILVTYRLSASDSAFVSQEFRSIRDSTTYIRHALTNSTWGDWDRTNDYVFLAKGSVGANTPFLDFPSRKVSVTYIESGSTSGFPEGSPGTLTTYRLSSDFWFTHQEYKIRGTSKIYVRSAIEENDGWGEWEPLNVAGLMPINTFSNTTQPREFPLNQITYTTIQNNFSEGLPMDRGGTLITFRLSVDESFIHQEFKPSNRNNIFTRTALYGGGWGEWEEK